MNQKTIPSLAHPFARRHRLRWQATASALSALLLLLGATSVQAKIALVPTQGVGLSEEDTILFDSALRRALKERGEDVLPRDETLAFIVGARSVGIECNQEEVECLTQLGGVFGTQEVMHVKVSRVVAGFQVTTLLVDVSKGQQLRAATELVTGSPRKLKRSARGILESLYSGTPFVDVPEEGGASASTTSVTTKPPPPAAQPPSVQTPPLWLLGVGGAVVVTGVAAMAGGALAALQVYRIRDAVSGGTQSEAVAAVDDIRTYSRLAWVFGASGVALVGVGAATATSAFLIE